MQARGVTPLEMAREYLATAHSSSGGRQMPVHGSYRRLGIYPPATPTASQCLPAVGAAWGIKLAGEPRVVLCTIGDASTRQGEFYEAVVQAVQDRLPIVFVVEDNGYGISTSTLDQLPFRLGIFNPEFVRHVDGRSVDAVAVAGSEAIAAARRGDGPTLLWVELDRLTSHTNSDDHRIYRSAAEIALMKERDPVTSYAASLIASGALDDDAGARLAGRGDHGGGRCVCRRGNRACPGRGVGQHQALRPVRIRLAMFRLSSWRTRPIPWPVRSTRRCARCCPASPTPCCWARTWKIRRVACSASPRACRRAIRVAWSIPHWRRRRLLAWAIGLAATGFRPILEMQFIDFIAPAFNQLLNQAATLRWRSNGDWTCPAVFYAPYGAYLPAGSTWHSQSNEGFWTHIPGLRVAVPSTPADLAGLLWSAMQESDPTLLLVPKHIMRVRHEPVPKQARGFGRARVVQTGSDITVVTWGNCLEVVQKAAAHHADRWSIEVIDLVSLVPCDWAAIDASVARTGRLVVVTEDARTGSFGQAIITEAVGSQARFNRFLSPPLLVAREDGHIPFNPVLEYAVLPDATRVHAALAEVMQ